jgi:hypothetical protein
MGSGASRQRIMRDRVGNDRQHRTRPWRTAPKLITDREMGAPNDARLDGPEFLACIAFTERVQIGYLWTLGARDTEHLSLFGFECVARSRSDVDCSRETTGALRNCCDTRSVRLALDKRRALKACHGQRGLGLLWCVCHEQFFSIKIQMIPTETAYYPPSLSFAPDCRPATSQEA